MADVAPVGGMDDRIVAAGAGAETRSGVVDETGGRTEKKRWPESTARWAAMAGRYE
jgi:hypothetical protein